MVAGSSRNLSVLLLKNTDSTPVDFSLIDTIVWRVTQGGKPILEKSLAAANIIMLRTTGYDTENNKAAQFIIKMLAGDTAPDTAAVPGIGSETMVMRYKHELRLAFVDGTQEVPEDFRGLLVIKPTRTWED